MTAAEILAEVTKLDVEERLDLVHAIWDSIADHPDAVPPLTDAQRAELDRRLADAEANPGAGISWEEMRRELLDEP